MTGKLLSPQYIIFTSKIDRRFTNRQCSLLFNNIFNLFHISLFASIDRFDLVHLYRELKLPSSVEIVTGGVGIMSD